VLVLAQEQFSYLADSAAHLTFELGDARLELSRKHEPFGLLVIDAFGSDAIPTHLLTLEALDLYDRRMSANGLIVFHVSNRYLDLAPVLAAAADHLGWSAWASRPEAWSVSEADEKAGKRTSWWVLLARRPEDAMGLVSTGRWRNLEAVIVRPWTDDFLSLADAIRWEDLLR
jgi:hypothetical protein